MEILTFLGFGRSCSARSVDERYSVDFTEQPKVFTDTGVIPVGSDVTFLEKDTGVKSNWVCKDGTFSRK